MCAYRWKAFYISIFINSRRPGFNSRLSYTKDSKNGTWHHQARIKGKVEQSSVVAIEKGAFRSPSTKVTNFTYFYLYIHITVWRCVLVLYACINEHNDRKKGKYIYIHAHTHFMKTRSPLYIIYKEYQYIHYCAKKNWLL